MVSNISGKKRLYRSKENKVLSGIFGGLGEYLDVDPTVIRLIFLALFFMTAIVPGIFFYLIALLIVPKKPVNKGS